MITATEVIFIEQAASQSHPGKAFDNGTPGDTWPCFLRYCRMQRAQCRHQGATIDADRISRVIEQVEKKAYGEVQGNVEAALAELCDLIDHGDEYPDAQWLVTQHYRVSAEDLQAAYDRYCGVRS